MNYEHTDDGSTMYFTNVKVGKTGQPVKALNEISSYFKGHIWLLERFYEILPESIDIYKKNLELQRKGIFEKLDKKEQVEYQEFVRNMTELNRGSIRSFEVPNRTVQELVSKHLAAIKYSFDFPTFVKEMGLVYIVSMFEQFLKDVLEVFFINKPTSLKSSQKSMTYEEIFDCDNIQEIRSTVIEKEIENVINNGIEEIKKYLKDKFGIDLAKNKNWEKFRERFYRRNIIIHNNSIPNKQYQLATGYSGQKVKLAMDDEYTREMIHLFREYADIIEDSFVSKFEKKT